MTPEHVDAARIAQRRADESVWRRHFGESAPFPRRQLGKTLDEWRLRSIEVERAEDSARDIRFALRRMPLWVRAALWWETRVRTRAALERRLQALLQQLTERSASDAKEYQDGYARGYASGRAEEKAEAMAAARAAQVRGPEA